MPISKYQALINMCKRGEFDRAKKALLDWALEAQVNGEFFDIHHAANIVKTYMLRVQ